MWEGQRQVEGQQHIAKHGWEWIHPTVGVIFSGAVFFVEVEGYGTSYDRLHTNSSRLSIVQHKNATPSSSVQHHRCDAPSVT